jgi:hypothetical protein
MDWLLLAVLVPLILIPVVLIYGFAGCGKLLVLDPGPAPMAPENLTGKAASLTQIDLAWTHPSPSGIEFIVSVLGPEGVWNEDFKRVPGLVQTSVPSLQPGTFYGFRVRAALNSVESGSSNVVMRRTMQWEPAFSRTLNEATSSFQGDCLVQRIDRNILNYTGVASRIRVTLRAASGEPSPMVIPLMTLSHAAEPGDDPLNPTPNAYDSRAPLVSFPSLQIPGGGTSLVLPERDFALDRNRDLLFAFDVDAANPTRGVRVAGGVGTSRLYRRNNVHMAATGNRSGTFGEQLDQVQLVEKIEVLTAEE